MDNGEDQAPQALLSVVLGGASVREFLAELCAIAVETSPGAHCGFTLDHHGQALTIAGSDAVAVHVQELERRYGDGPGSEAVRTRASVEIADLADDRRWPQLAGEALALGVGCGVWIPVLVGGRPVLVMSLTSARRRAFGEAQGQRAQAIADQAAAGLTLALRVSDRFGGDAAGVALTSRGVIDRALGILMHARQIGSGPAAEILLDLARAAELPPEDMAARIVADGAVDPHQPAT